jgi:hypothetical protein
VAAGVRSRGRWGWSARWRAHPPAIARWLTAPSRRRGAGGGAGDPPHRQHHRPRLPRRLRRLQPLHSRQLHALHRGVRAQGHDLPSPRSVPQRRHLRPGHRMCSNPAKTNGTACNDGNACTRTDTCQSGACRGGNPVPCTALDQCHGVGTCDPASGVCSNPVRTGGACNDGMACTYEDTCTSTGSCAGKPIVCMDDEAATASATAPPLAPSLPSPAAPATTATPAPRATCASPDAPARAWPTRAPSARACSPTSATATAGAGPPRRWTARVRRRPEQVHAQGHLPGRGLRG